MRSGSTTFELLLPLRRVKQQKTWEDNCDLPFMDGGTISDIPYRLILENQGDKGPRKPPVVGTGLRFCKVEANLIHSAYCWFGRVLCHFPIDMVMGINMPQWA